MFHHIAGTFHEEFGQEIIQALGHGGGERVPAVSAGCIVNVCYLGMGQEVATGKQCSLTLNTPWSPRRRRKSPGISPSTIVEGRANVRYLGIRR